MSPEQQPRLSRLLWLERPLFSLVFVAVIVANYFVFLWAPTERLMGAVQKIFYFHVGSAMASYCAIAIVLLMSIAYLRTRAPHYDIISEAAGEVGFVFCTIVLATGMIWAHAAWNVWFRWEPRLVTFLLLWLIFLAFNLLRIFGEPRKVAVHSAVLGILGAVTVPLVVYSIKLLPYIAQLHPQVIARAGLHPDMKTTMFITMAAVVLLQFLLVWIRARIGLLARTEH